VAEGTKDVGMADISQIMRNGLRDWASREPGRVALRFQSGEQLSYADLEALANRLASLFEASGLAHGDHVAVILGNDPHMLAGAWAAYRSGVYLTPIANTFSAAEIAYVVANSKAKLVIADAHYRETVSDLPTVSTESRRWLALGGDIPGWERLEGALEALPPTPREHEIPGALMLYSSGTTGAPKGIWRPLLTPEKIGDGPPPFARDLIEIFGIHSATRYLSPAPLYHAAPLRCTLAVSAAGGTSFIMRKFDAATALDLLRDEAITLSQWVPTMLQRMLALPEATRAAFLAPAHKIAIHAAAPCPPSVKRAMIAWWGPILREYYSGSESVGLATIDSHEWLAKPGSVGKVAKGVPHILDEAGRELPPGKVGAIYFSGVSKFAYFGEPEKTAARTSPDGYQTLGDVGYLDEDGYLFLADRLDDMIISGGVNLYPREIEIALEEAPGVAECAVIGVADEQFGERPIAFVVRAEGHAGDDSAFLAGLEAYCRARLGKTKQLKAFHLVASLPRTPTGKLLRRALRQTAPA
jgi:long-chain acyl-CoA synthetase